MSDNEIVWENPPASHRQGEMDWRERLLPLMARPGDWARVHEMNRHSAWTLVSQLRRGIKNRPEGRWEFLARTNQNDKSKAYIYARYLGPEGGNS